MIVTSHSYENIAKSLVGISAEGREDEFSLHRIERLIEGIHSDKEYDFITAQLAINSGLDVR